MNNPFNIQFFPDINPWTAGGIPRTDLLVYTKGQVVDIEGTDYLYDIIGPSQRANQKRQVMRFNGTTDFITLASKVSLVGDFDVEWYGYADDVTVANRVILGDSTTNNYIKHSGYSGFVIKIDGLYDTIAFTEDIINSTVYKFKVSRRGPTVTAYLNDIAGGSASLPTSDMDIAYIGKWATQYYSEDMWDLTATDSVGKKIDISHATTTDTDAALSFDRTGNENHGTVTAASFATFCTEMLGHGSNVLELEGYTVDTSTYAIEALIPLLSDLSSDCLLGTPTYTGRAKYSPEIISGSSFADYVLEFPATGDLYDVDDGTLFTGETPNQIDLSTFVSTDWMRVGSKALVIYSEDQTATNISKIDRIIGAV